MSVTATQGFLQRVSRVRILRDETSTRDEPPCNSRWRTRTRQPFAYQTVRFIPAGPSVRQTPSEHTCVSKQPFHKSKVYVHMSPQYLPGKSKIEYARIKHRFFRRPLSSSCPQASRSLSRVPIVSQHALNFSERQTVLRRASRHHHKHRPRRTSVLLRDRRRVHIALNRLPAGCMMHTQARFKMDWQPYKLQPEQFESWSWSSGRL